jgi:hypothetical protein
MMNNAALWQVFFEYFSFLYRSSFNQILDSSLSFRVGIVNQSIADTQGMLKG